MSAVLATVEDAYGYLLNLEDRIDLLVQTLDEHLADSSIQSAEECGAEIFELLRARIALKNFIDSN